MNEAPKIRPEDELLVRKTISQQAAKVKAYNSLKEMDLPIPYDLRCEIERFRNE